jgi:hypothetical protein
MTVAAYRYKYADWEARVMAFKPEWHYTGHNCKGDLPGDATIEPMYTQAYVQEMERQLVLQRDALDNVRIWASRNRKEGWAKQMLQFCEGAGSVPETLR